MDGALQAELSTPPASVCSAAACLVGWLSEVSSGHPDARNPGTMGSVSIYIYTSVYHSLSPLLAEYLYISRGQGFLNHQTYFSSKQADVCNNTETLLLGPGKEPLP